MPHRQWSQVKRVFDGAVGLSPKARDRYLGETCGQDDHLRSQILDLLAEDRRDQPLLDGALADGLSEVLSREIASGLTGQRLGAYRVIRPIGQGGESTVYLGHRDDGQFQQRVAIKVLDRTETSSLPQGLLEGQILARLNHPAIARLFDAGTTATGRSYFVMELVEGQPIDAYCDRQGLPLTNRLELFLQVCTAVQYAHQSLIVHSDLKPGNVLVTADGAPKLLDFGIARLLDSAVVPQMIETRRLALTPVYASPEQLRGESLTAASDVYSLGVILYQLLAGSRPPPLSKPPSHTARVARRPSRTWARRLRGDLDAIVLKALDPEARHRYPSVAELAADLRSHLDHRPVGARSGTWFYRSRRWLRRRWWVVAGLLLGLTALGALGLQERRLRSTLSFAQQEKAHAAAVTDFLDRLLEASQLNASPGEELTVRKVLDQASRALPLDLAHQPRVQGRLLLTLGYAYQTLGHLDRSEEAFEAAVRVHRHTVGEVHEATAMSLDRLAALRLQQGRLGEAEAFNRRALSIRQQLFDTGDLVIAESLHNLGEVLHARGDLEGALELYLRAEQIRRQDVGTQHPAYLESLFELARLFRDKGDPDTAEVYFRRALPLSRQLHGEHHTLTLQVTHDLAYLLRDSDQQQTSERLFRKAIDGYRRVLGPEHRWTSTATRNLARLLRNQNRFREAEELLLGVLESHRGLAPRGDLYTAYIEEDLGRLRLKEGDPATAEAHLRRALALLRDHLPPEDWRLGSIRSVLGECLTRLGHFEEAESFLVAGLRALEHQLGAESTRTVRARQRLEELRRAAGRSQQTPPQASPMPSPS